MAASRNSNTEQKLKRLIRLGLGSFKNKLSEETLGNHMKAFLLVFYRYSQFGQI